MRIRKTSAQDIVFVESDSQSDSLKESRGVKSLPMAGVRIDSAFVAFLRQRMAEVAMNGANLARRIGVGQPTVSKWLTGVALPGVEHLPDLSLVLGVDLADLTRLVAATKREPTMPVVEPPSLFGRIDELERWQLWAEGILTNLLGERQSPSGAPARPAAG